MLYTGYSEHELTRIIEILERHQVKFEVTADDQAIEFAQSLISTKFERSAHKKAELDNSFYAISFDRNGLKNLSADDFQDLKRLRIFAEDMAEPEAHEEKNSPVLPRKVPIQYVGSNPKTAILIFGALFCLIHL